MGSDSELKKIGRYEIISLIARGGMGIIYKAKDPIINRVVALKTVLKNPQMSEEEHLQYSQRFIREAQAVGQLVHPNIAGVYDAGTDQDTGISFIAMEFVEGKSLETLLESGVRFSLEEIISIGLQTAEALHFAHEKGVVHRDIKPANILVDQNNQVKVVDFGIARLAESTMTQTGQIMGTPFYMSPEQITGATIDRRSDIFSLGIVLYQVATAVKPFTGESFTTIAYQIIHNKPPPMNISNPHIPGNFEAVVFKALQKNPENRFQNCQQFAQELQSCQSGDHKAVPYHDDSEHEKTKIQMAKSIIIEITKKSPESILKKIRHFSNKKLVIVACAVVAVFVIFLSMLFNGNDAQDGDSVQKQHPSRLIANSNKDEEKSHTQGVPGLTPVTGESEEASPETEPQLAIPAPGKNQREDIKRLFEDGQVYYRDKKYTMVISKMEEILELDPENEKAKQNIDLSKQKLLMLVRGSTKTFDNMVDPPDTKTRRKFNSYLILKFGHHISSGAYTIYVDNWPLYTGALRAEKEKQFLPGVKISHQELRKQFKVPSGEHRITIEIVAEEPKIYNWRYITLEFKPDGSRTIIPEIQRVTNRMKLNAL